MAIYRPQRFEPSRCSVDHLNLGARMCHVKLEQATFHVVKCEMFLISFCRQWIHGELDPIAVSDCIFFLYDCRPRRDSSSVRATREKIAWTWCHRACCPMARRSQCCESAELCEISRSMCMQPRRTLQYKSMAIGERPCLIEGPTVQSNNASNRGINDTRHVLRETDHMSSSDHSHYLSKKCQRELVRQGYVAGGMYVTQR